MAEPIAFEELRKLTFSIAYRMTGEVSDAEDIVQEAFERLERARRDGAAVESPRARLLETLSPVERAVFLLREAFGYDHPEIAEAVGKGEENCRQIAAPARRHVGARRPRFEPDHRRREKLLDRFLAACENGDVDG
jgi:DNA-directed RNA polymerase specialized sigma24 family protein